MKRNSKNLVRLTSLVLAVLLFSSCSGCNFAELFNIVVPEETEESGNPITPDGSYTNSEGQSGLVDDSADKPTEEQTFLLTGEYNVKTEQEIQAKYWSEYVPYEKSEYMEYPEIKFLGTYNDAHAIYVLDDSKGGTIGVHYINGYEFRFAGEQTVYLYKDGQFQALQEALDSKKISSDDLKAIYDAFVIQVKDHYKLTYVPDPLGRFVIGELYIVLQPSYNSKEYTLEDFADIGCTKIRERDIYGEYSDNQIYRTIELSFDVNTKEETLQIVKLLEEREDVYAAQPLAIFNTDSLPNDTEYISANNDYWAINKISLPSAWDIETGDNTILVGVIDRGVDGSHPDLQGHIDTTLSKCFVNNCPCSDGLTDITGHGTQVAGIIGACANNTIGVAGVCWNVKLVSLKIAHESGDVTDFAPLAYAINYAKENGIKILNMSLSGGYDTNVRNAINANTDGLMICTAGNTLEGGHSIDVVKGDRHFPAYPICWTNNNILGVAASTPTDQRKQNSNFGATSVDLFAPGENILTTYPVAMCQSGQCNYDHTAVGAYSVGYHYFQNTSAAAPFVSGVAALVLAQNPTFTATQIKARILDNVEEIEGLEDECVTGGRLNAFETLHISHNYTDHYYIYDETYHFALCICGESVLQRHTNSMRCTKCRYDGQIVPVPGIMSKKDEEETE